MKTSILFILGLTGWAATAAAELAIPRGVYRAGQISEAVAAALESGKALAFVLTDPGTS